MPARTNLVEAAGPQSAQDIDTSRNGSEILPSYLLHDRDRIAQLLTKRLGFLNKTRLNYILRCVEKPTNGLFNRLLPHLYVPEEERYICVAETVFCPAKNHEFVKAYADGGMPLGDYQEHAQYFCNALRLPAFRVVARSGVGPDRKEAKRVEWLLAPSERTVNCGLYVQTLEFDPRALDIREFLSTQIGWCLGRDDGKSVLDDVYEAMCRYRDFRHVELVWSGHKSCHLHLAFDTRHLASTRFSGGRELTPSPDIADIDDPAILRAGFASGWHQLTAFISPVLGVADVAPDPTLRFPETFRRLGNGQRLVKESDKLGFEAGSLVPQVVLYSRGRAYARAATEWFHHPERFVEAARHKPSRRRTTTRPAMPALEGEAEAFIEALSELCERIWGDPQTNPRPAALLDDPDGFKVTFYNHATDATPSSVIRRC